MWLVQVFLPVSAGSGDMLRDLKEELTSCFGGLTAHSRAPAEGIWRNGDRKEEDEIIILEVMADDLDREWWRGLRTRLERALNQEEVVVRAQAIERL